MVIYIPEKGGDDPSKGGKDIIPTIEPDDMIPSSEESGDDWEENLLISFHKAKHFIKDYQLQEYIEYATPEMMSNIETDLYEVAHSFFVAHRAIDTLLKKKKVVKGQKNGVVVQYNGENFDVQIALDLTVKNLRQTLRLNFPLTFTSDDMLVNMGYWLGGVLLNKHYRTSLAKQGVTNGSTIVVRKLTDTDKQTLEKPNDKRKLKTSKKDGYKKDGSSGSSK